MDPIPKPASVEIPLPYETEGVSHWFRLDYETLKKVLISVGCLSVRGAQVIAYRYVNTQSHHTYESYDGPMGFEQPIEIPDLIEQIGDFGMNEEFPNNFIVALAVQIDESNRLLVQYDCDAQPNVCDDCEPTHEDEHHSCGHVMDFVDATYSVHHGAISDHTVQDALAFM